MSVNIHTWNTSKNNPHSAEINEIILVYRSNIKEEIFSPTSYIDLLPKDDLD